MFLDRVPVELSAWAHGKHTEVGHAGRAMAHTHRADRLLACLDTVNEIGHAVAPMAHTRSTIRQLAENVAITGLNHAAASDPDPTVRTDELDAVLLTLKVQDRAKRRGVSRALAVVDHTVGIDVLQFVLAGSCVDKSRGQTSLTPAACS